MVKTLYLPENEPYPNNSLPVLYYEDVLSNTLDVDFNANDVIKLFENNGYTHGWKGIIEDRHHFHSHVHEALAVTKGEVTVQLGGPNGEIQTLRQGDVVLLPAGVAHKRLDGSENFEVVGAYPSNGQNLDMQYGDASDYKGIKENIANVDRPLTDPVTGNPGDLDENWPTPGR